MQQSRTLTHTTAAPDDGQQRNEKYIEIKKFSFYYSGKQALFDIDLNVAEKRVTALIGPSGCGKSTLLRNLNRMNDLVDHIRHEGGCGSPSASSYVTRVKSPSSHKSG